MLHLVDDTLFMCKTNTENVLVTKNILIYFELASTQE